MFLRIFLILAGLSSWSSLAQASLSPQSEPLLIEWQQPPTALQRRQILAWPGVISLQRFSPIEDPYFARLDQLEVAVDRLEAIQSKLRAMASIRAIEKQQAVEALSVIPPAHATNPTQDPYFLYQWSLWNQEQTVVRDLDDVHSTRLPGMKGADAGWWPARNAFESKLTRDPIVAVLDTGASFEHPDLKQSWYLNPKECSEQNLPIANTTEDRDGNGYPGDCIGWNFATDATEKNGNNRPLDISGHGTHIAGILAAKADNGEGISGLSSRIRILPIKVLSEKENQMAQGLTFRLAQGILYALHRKVDVINLSLGWPRSLDSSVIRNAVRVAQTRGILVVAAAGNNSNPANTFPCAYAGVLCVGAINHRGELAVFSNYGGNVDLLAPGDTILSTIPTRLIPEFFSGNGYDYKDGTSQATPFVAGAAAILKAVFPTETPAQIKARLLLSTSSSLPQNALFGWLQIGQALEATPMPVFYPQWKGLEEVTLDPIAKTITFAFSIENLWQATRSATIQVRAQGPLIQTQSWTEVLPFQAGEVRPFTFTTAIQDLKADNRIRLQLEIRTDPNSRTWNFEREISAISPHVRGQWTRYPIATVPMTLGTQYKDTVQTELNTVASTTSAASSERASLEYFVESTSKEKLESQILLFRKIGDQIAPVGNPLVEKNIHRFMGFFRLPEVLSPEPSKALKTARYAAVYSRKDLATPFVEYCFLNAAFERLAISDRGCVRYEPQVSIPLQNAQWTPIELEGMQIFYPSTIESAALPESCQNKNPWIQEDRRRRSRLFSFLPVAQSDHYAFQLQCIDNASWRDQLTSKLDLQWNDVVLPLQWVRSASPQDPSVQSVLFLIGKGASIQEHILHFRQTQLLNTIPLQGDYPHLAGFSKVPTIRLGQIPEQNFFSAFYSGTAARVSRLDPDGTVQSQIATRTLDQSLFLGLNGLFYTEDSWISVFFSKTRLILIENSAKTARSSEHPLVRFSFLTGQALNTFNLPISIWNPTLQRQEPGFAIDGTAIASRELAISRVVLDPVAAPRLEFPAHMQQELPVGCVPMTPLELDRIWNWVLFCRNPETTSSNTDRPWELRLFPIQF